jgi:hypothetical protein
MAAVKNKSIKSLVRSLEQNFLVFLIALIYCFIGSLYNSNILLSGSGFSGSMTHREDGFDSFAAYNLLGCVNNAENYNGTNHNLPVFSFRKHQNIYDFLYRAADIQIIHNYREYSAHFTETIVPLKSPDIIFPFNYF